MLLDTILDLIHNSTPSVPAGGRSKLYPKGSNVWYTLDSNGDELKFVTENDEGLISAQFVRDTKAQSNLTGGGHISFYSTNLYWTQRFIVISNGSSSGYHNITIPSAGTVITGIGGHSDVTVTGSGITLAAWDALYYILPNEGSSSASDPTRFRVASYSAPFSIGANWVLIGVYNSETGVVRLGNGREVVNNTIITPADPFPQYSSTSHNHSGVYEPAFASGTTAQYRRGDKSWQTLDKTAVGLGNVDNTSDANKPVSGPQLAGITYILSGYQTLIASGTTAQYYRGDKTWQTLDKTTVGLNNVLNVDMTNLSNATAGTVPDPRLPPRLRSSTQGISVVTDWDDAVESGWICGYNATNAPASGWFIGVISSFEAWVQNRYVTQKVWNISAVSNTDSQCFERRAIDTGITPTWTAWRRVRYLQEELDVLYQATIASGTTAQYYRGDKSWQTLDKAAVGLGNVDNTSDVTKVFAAQAYFDGRYSLLAHNHSGVYEPVLTAGTTSQYYRGDKSWQTLDKAAVGLGNVPNLAGDKMAVTATGAGLTAGWVRIATQTNGLGSARFTVYDTTGSTHNVLEFEVSVSYNNVGGGPDPQINILRNTRYGALSLTGVRIARDIAVYTNVMVLEVQIQSITSLNVAMMENMGPAPWVLVTPSNTALGGGHTTFTTVLTDGSPGIYTSGRVFAAGSIIANGNITSYGSLDSANQTMEQGLRVWSGNNTGPADARYGQLAASQTWVGNNVFQGQTKMVLDHATAPVAEIENSLGAPRILFHKPSGYWGSIKLIAGEFQARYGDDAGYLSIRGDHVSAESGVWDSGYRVYSAVNSPAISALTGAVSDIQLPSRVRTNSSSNVVADADTIIESGFAHISTGSPNKPAGVNDYHTVSNMYSSQYGFQIGMGFNQNTMHYRGKTSNVWAAWQQIASQTWVTANFSQTSHNHAGVYEPAFTTGTAGYFYRADKTWQPFPTFNQNTTGSAATLTTGRTIGMTGDLSWTTAAFNGSANVTATGTLATVNSNVGAFGSASSVATFTVNAKGLTTAAASTAISIGAAAVSSGTLGTARLGSGTANSTKYLRGDSTWQDLNSASVGLSLVNNVAQVEIASNQTITGIKTFSTSPIVPTATNSTHAVTKGQMDTAIAAVPTMGQEMGYAERTTVWTTTNTTNFNKAAGALITGLSVTVVGTGRPVEIEFYTGAQWHSVANMSTATYLVSKIGATYTNETIGASMSSITFSGQTNIVKRRKVLVSGTTYTFEVGAYGVAAGTTSVFGSTDGPAYLSVTQR